MYTTPDKQNGQVSSNNAYNTYGVNVCNIDPICVIRRLDTPTPTTKQDVSKGGCIP